MPPFHFKDETMSEVFAECTSVPDGTALRQGDVFVFRDSDENHEIWQQFGIVVTADCDLANNKHHGILSYVPVLPLRDYLARVTVPRLASDQRARSLQRMSDAIKQAEDSRGVADGLSTRAIEEFATMRDGAQELIAHLDQVSSDQRDRISEAIAEVAACDRLSALSSYADMFSALVKIYKPTRRKTAEELLAADLRNRLSNLPGDAFFIGTLDDSRRGGYVAYLRLVRELRNHQVCTTYFKRYGRGILAERISRLEAPYLYRLTQLLAEVFASIGLPEEYESARDEVIETNLLPTPLEVSP
jgi:hypothetical protein